MGGNFRSSRWILLGVVAFWLGAGTIALNWHRIAHEPVPPVTFIWDLGGDEAHYIVLTRSLFVHGSFDTELAYRESWQPPAMLGPDQAHVVPSRDGDFSPVHGLGLPLLLAAGWAVAGVWGAKITMLLISGSVVAVVCSSAARLFQSARMAMLAAFATAFTVPLVIGATQIYPDILAGAICLTVFAVVTVGKARKPMAADVSLGLLAALLPWLQVKNVIAAILCGIAMVLSLRRAGERRRALLVGGLVLVSVVAMCSWHLYQWGRLTGPFNSNSSEYSLTSVMVFFGLHVDRAHGILAVSPLLAIGLVEMVIRLIRRERWSLLVPLTYLSLLAPNATHVNWYGGYSLAGRFGWSAAVLLMLPTLQGIRRLHRRAPRGTMAVCAASIALQVAFAVNYGSGGHYLYNQPAQVPLDGYSSLWGPFKGLLPALYNRDLVPDVLANWVWGIAFAALAVGLVLRVRRKPSTAEASPTVDGGPPPPVTVTGRGRVK